MSTKIFNGFRVFRKDNTKILDAIKSIEKTANIQAKNYLYKLFITYAVHCVDHYLFFKNDFDLNNRKFKNKNISTLNHIFENHIDLEFSTKEIENYNIFKNNNTILDNLSGLYQILSEHTKQKFYTRICDFDATFYISVFKNGDNYFLIPNCEQENIYIPIIENQKIFKNYHYWDHTDGDERIKDRLWSKRANDWNSVIYDDPIKNYTIISPDKIVSFYHDFLNDIKNKTLASKYIDLFEKNQKTKIESYAKNRTINDLFHSYIKERNFNFMVNDLSKLCVSDTPNSFILKTNPAKFLLEIDEIKKENTTEQLKDTDPFYIWLNVEHSRINGLSFHHQAYVKAKKLIQENDPTIRQSYDDNLKAISGILNSNQGIYDYLNQNITLP